MLVEVPVELVADRRSRSRFDLYVADAPHDVGPAGVGEVEQRRAGLGVADVEGPGDALDHHPEGQGAGLGLRRRAQLVVEHGLLTEAATGRDQRVLGAEGAHLDHAPRLHVLAAFAIVELVLALEHHHGQSPPGERGGSEPRRRCRRRPRRHRSDPSPRSSSSPPSRQPRSSHGSRSAVLAQSAVMPPSMTNSPPVQ